MASEGPRGRTFRPMYCLVMSGVACKSIALFCSSQNDLNHTVSNAQILKMVPVLFDLLFSFS